MTKKTLMQLYAEHEGNVSDKWSIYLTEYDRILDEYRDMPIRLLEIGVQNGGSIEIWSKFFPKAQQLVGCDINPECAKLTYENPRIAVVVGDANSDAAQAAVMAHAATFDVIIDDGSHRSSDIVKSFAKYFPCLADAGVFVVEDLHCGYWQEFEGGLFNPFSSTTFFKRLADIVSHEHWGVEKAPSDILSGFFTRYGFQINDETLLHIHSVEFINSMCVIRKDVPEKNRLGTRFIAGSVESVVPGHLGLHSSQSLALDQVTNEWTARRAPPDEEFLIRIKELAERDAQIASLSQTMAERDAQIASLSQTMAERDAQIAALYSSTSWRITWPLRIVARQIKHGMHAAGFPVSAIQRGGGKEFANQLTPLSAGQTLKMDSWRPSLTRFQMICGSLDLDGRGIEVGPSYNPILPKNQGYSVLVVDHMSADGLREKYRAWNVDTSAIEEVDVIWKSESFAEAFEGEDRFDYIVASHVIEHIPDPIRFLQDCEKILKPNGKLSLVVPDKRFCFDLYRPLTTTGEWIEAYLQKHTVHPPRKHFDHLAYAVKKGDAIAWGKESLGEIVLQGQSLKEAMAHAERLHLSGQYQDVHGWQFIPESFSLVLQEIHSLGFINSSILVSYPTHGFEFYVTLGLSPKKMTNTLSEVERQALVKSSFNSQIEGG